MTAKQIIPTPRPNQTAPVATTGNECEQYAVTAVAGPITANTPTTRSGAMGVRIYSLVSAHGCSDGKWVVKGFRSRLSANAILLYTAVP